LAKVEPLNLEEVKARTIASIKANPDDLRDDEAIAPESGPPRDEQPARCSAWLIAHPAIPRLLAFPDEASVEISLALRPSWENG